MKAAPPRLNIITQLSTRKRQYLGCTRPPLEYGRTEMEKRRAWTKIDECKTRKEAKRHRVIEGGRQTEQWLVGGDLEELLFSEHRRVSEAALGSWFKATNSKSIFYSLSKQTHPDTRTGPEKGRTHTHSSSSSSNHKQADNTRHCSRPV